MTKSTIIPAAPRKPRRPVEEVRTHEPKNLLPLFNTAYHWSREQQNIPAQPTVDQGDKRVS